MTLALAFYGVADLPSLYDSFDLNYFELAADWLLALPEVRGARLGLYGSSTGGNLALSIMSSTPDKVAACVVSGAAFASLPGHTYYQGQASHISYITHDDDDMRRICPSLDCCGEN